MVIQIEYTIHRIIALIDTRWTEVDKRGLNRARCVGIKHRVRTADVVLESYAQLPKQTSQEPLQKDEPKHSSRPIGMRLG